MPEITQQELDALKADAAKGKDVDSLTIKLKEKDDEIESVRLEVLTPEYTKFLDSLEGGSEPKKKEEPKYEDDEFEKLTKRQLYERAKVDLKAELKGEQTRIQEDVQKQRKAKTDKAILDFSKTHDDFEQFKPVMYGLSLRPEMGDYNLDQLYEAAKEHVLRISGKMPEKKKASGKGLEKPGGGSLSYTNDELKKMSNEAIAEKSLEEVKAELGDIPRA